MTSSRKRSAELFSRARTLMPGGVSSPVRAFGAVGGEPVFFRSGQGAMVTDADGNNYVDLIGSWGPLILGHADPKVVAAVQLAATAGTSFGAPVAGEAELAQLIVDAVGSIDMVRLVSSGTEAAMSALRLARAATGRAKIVKFEGCYHGHVDALLVSAGSGPATLGLADSPGVTDGTRADTVVCRYNSTSDLDDAFARFQGEIAAVIIEPIAANMGVVPPVPGFLEHLRKLCDANGSLLIFDEVITGFRVHHGGAQGLLGVTQDLTIMGKIIGGGLPVGAYGGSADLMELIAPQGPVYQAGTLSGNPISVAAGIATLSQLGPADPYPRLEALAIRLQEGLERAAKDAGVPVVIQRVGSMFTLFFQDQEVWNLTDAKASDTKRFAAFFNAMLDQGVYWPPSQFESAFISRAHDETHIDQIVKAAEVSFERISDE